MRKIVLTILFCGILSIVYAQLYSGRSLDYQKNFCELKINEDSSVYFIVNDMFNVAYEEYFGNIVKVNDTLYRLIFKSLFKEEPFNNNIDTLRFTTHDNFSHINKVTVEYEDGFRSTYDLGTIQTDYTRREFDPNDFVFNKNIPLDTGHIHYQSQLDPITGKLIRYATTALRVDVGHKNPISGKLVFFGTSEQQFGMDFSKMEGEEEYYVVSEGDDMKIKNNILFASDVVKFTDVHEVAIYYYRLTKNKK